MPATPYDQLRYDQVRARGSHNSYQRDEDIADQLLYWRLRHIELDLHVTAGVRREGPKDPIKVITTPGNWYVYHISPTESPNVKFFTDGLALLAGFHRAVPDHEVVTVALDIKQSFDRSHTPEELDGLINQALPGLVFTPSAFIKSVDGTNLRDARDAKRWPLLKDLRGKFIFILTTGGLSPGSQLFQYAGAGQASTRTCFVAPEISKVEEITSEQNREVLFFNMTVSDAPKLASTVLTEGAVSRAYGANSRSDFDKAKDAKANLIGTDNVNTDTDPWSRTHSARGWPFEGITPVTVADTLVEPGVIYQVAVTSGDIYDSTDSGVFRFDRVALEAAGSITYTMAVGVPSSHTANKNGKAGLMARESKDANAPNFAVLRVADNNEPRAQVRRKKGNSTDQYKVDVAATPGKGITGESWMWVRMTLSNGGKTVSGATSYDGSTWIELRTETFDTALTLVGFACSSHNTGASTRYFFVPVQGPKNFGPLNKIGKVQGATSQRGLSLPRK